MKTKNDNLPMSMMLDGSKYDTEPNTIMTKKEKLYLLCVFLLVVISAILFLIFVPVPK